MFETSAKRTGAAVAAAAIFWTAASCCEAAKPPAKPARTLHLDVKAAAGGDGSKAKPFNDIRTAIRALKDGDVLIVAPGTYLTPGPLTVSANHVTIKSTAGPAKTHIKITQPDTRGIIFWGSKAKWREGFTLEGFEVSGKDARTKKKDGLLRFHFARKIRIADCWVHDAGYDCDCLKFTHVDGVVIERCRTWTPGARTADGKRMWQENMDFIASDNVVIRNCHFFHLPGKGDRFLYFKGGLDKTAVSENAVVENCVFGPTGGVFGNAAVMGGTPSAGAKNILFRNNIFYGCTHGAFGPSGGENIYVVNNTFVNNGRQAFGVTQAHGGRGGQTKNCRFLNNIIADLDGRMRAVWCKQNHVKLPGWLNANNLYWNGGKPIPAGGKGTFRDPNAEPGHLVGDPKFPAGKLPAPGAPMAEIIKAFTPGGGSAAKSKARDLSARPYEITKDFTGKPRPKPATIGAVEVKLPEREGRMTPPRDRATDRSKGTRR